MKTQLAWSLQGLTSTRLQFHKASCKLLKSVHCNMTHDLCSLWCQMAIFHLSLNKPFTRGNVYEVQRINLVVTVNCGGIRSTNTCKMCRGAAGSVFWHWMCVAHNKSLHFFKVEDDSIYIGVLNYFGILNFKNTWNNG